MTRTTKNIQIKTSQIKFTKYGNFLPFLFVKNILKHGKESIANRIVNKTLFLLEYKLNCNSIKVLEEAVFNAKIDFDLKPITSKSSLVNLPIEMDSYRSINQGIKNIIALTNYKSKLSLSEKLFLAILDSFYKKGDAVKKCIENLQIANRYKTTLYEDID